MSIKLYDDALTKKIQDWITDPSLHVLPPDETLRLQAKLSNENDKPITLPMICLSREPALQLNIPGKKELTNRGLMISKGQSSGTQLNAISMRLDYRLDIYTRYFAEADEYVRNFIFNFINDPTLHLIIPYKELNMKYSVAVYLNSTIEDTSASTQYRLQVGQFTRFTLHLFMDDAKLWSVPTKDAVKVVLPKCGEDVIDENNKEI